MRARKLYLFICALLVILNLVALTQAALAAPFYSSIAPGVDLSGSGENLLVTVDLTQGGGLVLLHGGVKQERKGGMFGGSDTMLAFLPGQNYWNHLSQAYKEQAVCVTPGTPWEMGVPHLKTPMKVGGQVITEGWQRDSLIKGSIMMLEIWPDHVKLSRLSSNPEEARQQFYGSDAPDILTGYHWDDPGSNVNHEARTVLGVINEKKVVIAVHKGGIPFHDKTRQDLGHTMVEYMESQGVARENLLVLDGGKTSQLTCQGKKLIDGQIHPMAIGIITGGKTNPVDPNPPKPEPEPEGPGLFGQPIEGVTSHNGSGFGASSAYDYNGRHTGLDYIHPQGTAVLSSCTGEVVFYGNWPTWATSPWVNTAWVKCDVGGWFGSTHTWLGKYHAEVGQRVTKSEIIAYIGPIGESGLGDRDHLHQMYAKCDPTTAASIEAACLADPAPMMAPKKVTAIQPGSDPSPKVPEDPGSKGPGLPLESIKSIADLGFVEDDRQNHVLSENLQGISDLSGNISGVLWHQTATGPVDSAGAEIDGLHLVEIEANMGNDRPGYHVVCTTKEVTIANETYALCQWLIDTNAKAWHALEYNNTHLAVSYVDTVKEGPPTPAQLRSLYAITLVWMKQFDIPAENVQGHKEVHPDRRADPIGVEMSEARANLEKMKEASTILPGKGSGEEDVPPSEAGTGFSTYEEMITFYLSGQKPEIVLDESTSAKVTRLVGFYLIVIGFPMLIVINLLLMGSLMHHDRKQGEYRGKPANHEKVASWLIKQILSRRKQQPENLDKWRTVSYPDKPWIKHMLRSGVLFTTASGMVFSLMFVVYLPITPRPEAFNSAWDSTNPEETPEETAPPDENAPVGSVPFPWGSPYPDDPNTDADNILFFGSSMAAYNLSQPHNALDIRCPKGAEIKAAGPGKVDWIDPTSTWPGRSEFMVMIAHGQTSEAKGVYSGYAHLLSASVKEGDWVQAGDVIGTCGPENKDPADTTHVHWMLSFWPLNNIPPEGYDSKMTTYFGDPLKDFPKFIVPLEGAPEGIYAASEPEAKPTEEPTSPVTETDHVTTLAVVSDFGNGGKDANRVADEIVKRWNPSIVVSAGDNRHQDTPYSESVPEYYLSLNRDGQKGFFPAPGNHDYSELDGIKGFLKQFGDVTGGKHYYAVTTGPVQICILDSMSAWNDNADWQKQINWLRDDCLKQGTWQLVVYHHPPYSSAGHGSQTEALIPDLAKWGADAVINGHNHVYERVMVEEDGYTLPYIEIGLGGSGKYKFDQPIVTGSTVRYNAEYGALKVEATDTSLSFTFHSLDGEVDRYVIQAKPPYRQYQASEPTPIDFLWQRPLPHETLVTKPGATKIVHVYRATGTGYEIHHTGHDLVCTLGEEVRAVAAGKVELTTVDYSFGDGVMPGGYVEIHHGTDPSTGLGYYTEYAHLIDVLVKQNQWVQAGEVVGTCGQTSGLPHLHFQSSNVPVTEMSWQQHANENPKGLGWLDPLKPPSKIIPLVGAPEGLYTSRTEMPDTPEPEPEVAPIPDDTWEKICNDAGYSDCELLITFAQRGMLERGRNGFPEEGGKVFPWYVAAAIPAGETNTSEWANPDPTQPGPWGKSLGWTAYEDYMRQNNRFDQKLLDACREGLETVANNLTVKTRWPNITAQNIYTSAGCAIGRGQTWAGHFASDGFLRGMENMDFWSDNIASADAVIIHLIARYNPSTCGASGPWWDTGNVEQALCAYNPNSWGNPAHAWYWDALRQKSAKIQAAWEAHGSPSPDRPTEGAPEEETPLLPVNETTKPVQMRPTTGSGPYALFDTMPSLTLRAIRAIPDNTILDPIRNWLDEKLVVFGQFAYGKVYGKFTGHEGADKMLGFYSESSDNHSIDSEVKP